MPSHRKYLSSGSANPNYSTKSYQQGDRHKDSDRGRIDPYDFAVVDGEALSVPDGQKQPYYLLGAFDGYNYSSVVGLPYLRTKAVFDFLFSLNKRTLWTFYGTYDVNHWLRDLPKNDIERLATSEHSMVRWYCYPYNYTIKHIYNKLFQVSRYDGKQLLGTVRVWDMGSYVQTKFTDMLTSWQLTKGPEEDAEMAEILAMKEERENFDLTLGVQIKHYNALELKYLYRAVNHLIGTAKESGYLPSVWYSPGSLAAQAMKKHHIKDYAFTAPPLVQEAAEEAYRGGRAESAMIGWIEDAWAYDLRSAYPAAAIELPSLLGDWGHVENVDLNDPALIALVHTSWCKPRKDPRFEANKYWGPFPIKWELQALQYPAIQKRPAWYWSWEVAAARPYADIKVHDAWVFKPATEDRPFAYLKQLYDLRAIMKQPETYNAQEIVLKLIMNSTYGKLAQRPVHDKVGPYRNLIWAGMITSKCRAKLLDAAKDGGVMMFATDAVYSEKRLSLPLTERLGDWEEKRLDSIFIAQPGVYITKSDNKTKVKMRGIRARKIDPQDVIAAWENGEKGFTATPGRFIGYRWALQTDFDNWLTWITDEKNIDFDLGIRRDSYRRSSKRILTLPRLEYRYEIVSYIIAEGRAAEAKPIFKDDLELEQPDLLGEWD